MNGDRYREKVLWVLMGVSAFNFLDRQILIILQESVKTDLGLSDTQLGLLTGFAFSIFYVTMGLPLARLADRFKRTRIIALCLGGWSLMTVLSGLTQNFVQLLLARVGVGIGEAGGAPPSHSLISDYFPPEKRSIALAIFSLGIYLGVMLGLLVGGVLDNFFGWRLAFILAGIPGVLYALFLYIYVKEPRRGAMDTIVKLENSSLWLTIKEILSNRSFIYLSLGGASVAFIQYGVGNWIPPFLFRYHGMSSMGVGLLTACTFGLGGALGTVAGGYLSDHFGKNNKGWYFWWPLIGVIGSIPFVLAICFAQNLWIVGALLFFPVFLFALHLAPSLAVAHNLVSQDKRALSSAMFFFILNLVGLGLGPLFVGALSDWLDPVAGQQSLRWSISCATLAGIPASYCYYKAARHVGNEWA